ncbi:MAG: type I restriction endonuclease subunit R [Agathobacter sp.]
MAFSDEASFEEALIKALIQNGWESQIIKYPTEEDLIRNWAAILFENNQGIDRLNGCPLTDSEMQQIMEQIATLRTPLKLNGFINGKTVAITRDNPKDTLHVGKEVSLKIYDRREIAAGQSRYQIVEQPVFARREKVLHDRRGDLMLLINGMPVFHLELKKSGIDISQACNQIRKYAHEGIFTGLFSLVQVFAAMTPEETLYFANPGPDGQFNKDYYFHWADFNNEPINDWKQIASTLLSIPMAHQLIGFYTVADDADGVLKVMRSYQYYAANRISDCVAKIDWISGKQLGGYIWHTTGSGKTMTSFKSAQLIATSKDADKVIFLMDRIELGTQSLKEYRAFADDADSVQETEDTVMLISKLKSNDPKDTLIVTSIQKMSNIKDDAQGLRSVDIEVMSSKRIVFIVDEAHRSTFGDMLLTIKHTFPNAIFFGFTGTPIQEENQKKMNTTATVFGNELHRYSIADGIRDKNVLGFDPYMVLTYKDKDIRQEVALRMAKAKTQEEALADPKKSEIFYRYMDPDQVPMAGDYGTDGIYVKGIEDFVSKAQYNRSEHRNKVVEDILDNWMMLSHNGKFHAIFATNSIPEAVEYYRLIREKQPGLKVTALFDPSIDNDGEYSLKKEDGIAEMLKDYNEFFQQQFDMAGYAKFKKDVSARLAHKKPYERIEKEQQLDLLIVVNQMLTGFDSKWINTLYLDKVLEYENIIQAFSRTNRLFGPDKPFGTIRYYRLPHTMKRNVDRAVKLYSGDKVPGLFVQHLEENLNKMNGIFDEIEGLFRNAGIVHFESLPVELPVRGKFAKLFKQFNEYKEAASIQGFTWEKNKYGDIQLHFDETIYLTLAQRYKELFSGKGENGTSEDIPFEIDGYLIEIDTGKIDSDYMNSRFEKYLKVLEQKDVDPEMMESTLEELHGSFAALSQEEQKYANLFLHDVQSGDATLQPGMKFRDYIVEYEMADKNDQIHRVSCYFGLSEKLLRDMMERNVTENNINEYGRLKELQDSVDKDRAKAYFEAVEGKILSPPKVNICIDKFLRKFILEGGCDLPDPFSKNDI